MSEVKRFKVFMGWSEGGDQDCVKASDYDALAAQRDKGYRSAIQLAEAMSKDVADLSPKFGYFDNTWGVIGQIDNMYAGMRAQRDEGLAREAELKRQLKETPMPQDIAAELERTDWTPEQALKWYAEGKHFDVVAGRTRIIDTGHVASNALKHLSAEYLEHKGDAQLHELQQRLAEAKDLLEKAEEWFEDAGEWDAVNAIRAWLASPGCADGEKQACSNCNGTKRVHVDKGWTLPCSVCADGEKAE